MAIKFPKKQPVNGEVCHPDDINDNVSEFVNEINGNLDADNFTETGINREQFADDSFFRVEVFSRGTRSTGSGYVSGSVIRVPDSTTAFVKRCHTVTDPTYFTAGAEFSAEYSDETYPVGTVTFTAEHEGWIHVDFQGSILWKGTGIVDLDHLHSHHSKQFHGIPPEKTSPQIAVTGFFNPYLPAGGWCGISGKYPDGGAGIHKFDDLITIATSMSEASHPDTTLPGIKHENFPQGAWHTAPVDHYAVQFRIVLNGNVLAESGFLYNGNASYGFHLTGVSPVTAGQHTVDVEVRGVDLKPHAGMRSGLGALDDEMISGQTTPPLIEGVNLNFQPLPKYEPFGFLKLDIEEYVHDFHENFPGISTYAGHVDTRGQTGTSSSAMFNIEKGIACDIEDRLLMVQYRKR
tara:strand:- start:2105 stop:3319 length:1215 start_codon:yes stop_codon:yes gene_type:complete